MCKKNLFKQLTENKIYKPMDSPTKEEKKKDAVIYM